MTTIIHAATVATLCAACWTPATAHVADPTPRIAVMSAFQPELAELLAVAENAETRVLHNVAFTTATLEGRDVVLFLSGISTVNAAMTTQMALDHFTIERILFSGIAGGVDPELGIGDVVVAARWSPYFDLHVARENEDGAPQFPSYYTPTSPGFGVFFPRGVSTFSEGRHNVTPSYWFEVDPEMLEAATRAVEGLELEPCGPSGACLERRPEIHVGGAGVSGSAFVDNAAFRDYVFETYRARVLDMESAAVAQVASTNETPFLAVRSLSDLAGGGAGDNEIVTFFDLAARNAAIVVRAVLRQL